MGYWAPLRLCRRFCARAFIIRPARATWRFPWSLPFFRRASSAQADPAGSPRAPRRTRPECAACRAQSDRRCTSPSDLTLSVQGNRGSCAEHMITRYCLRPRARTSAVPGRPRSLVCRGLALVVTMTFSAGFADVVSGSTPRLCRQTARRGNNLGLWESDWIVQAIY
jgi:hypothetical protein